ncbi:BrnA antitoxin family protein [uncultured Thiodictyon sp.]|nr:BrnA antitoxin family protein [uncultured Thiodictyon sp.]
MILEALKTPPPEGYYVWDGVNEDDRPATEEELAAALKSYRQRRGRPTGSEKTQIALRVDNDTLAAFKATGRGWQTRMNAALREWLKDHSAA